MLNLKIRHTTLLVSRNRPQGDANRLDYGLRTVKVGRARLSIVALGPVFVTVARAAK